MSHSRKWLPYVFALELFVLFGFAMCIAMELEMFVTQRQQNLSKPVFETELLVRTA